MELSLGFEIRWAPGPGISRVIPPLTGLVTPGYPFIRPFVGLQYNYKPISLGFQTTLWGGIWTTKKITPKDLVTRYFEWLRFTNCSGPSWRFTVPCRKQNFTGWKIHHELKRYFLLSMGIFPACHASFSGVHMLGHQFSKKNRGLESRSLHTSPSVPLAAVDLQSVSIGRGTGCYHENLRKFPPLGAHPPLEIRPQWWLRILNLRPYFLKGRWHKGSLKILMLGGSVSLATTTGRGSGSIQYHTSPPVQKKAWHISPNIVCNVPILLDD